MAPRRHASGASGPVARDLADRPAGGFGAGARLRRAGADNSAPDRPPTRHLSPGPPASLLRQLLARTDHSDRSIPAGQTRSDAGDTLTVSGTVTSRGWDLLLQF